MIQIDKNIPLPNKARKSNPKYPWKEMQVGDSFLAKGVKISAIVGGAWLVGKRLNFKFSCRTVDGGVRVWRIA